MAEFTSNQDLQLVRGNIYLLNDGSDFRVDGYKFQTELNSSVIGIKQLLPEDSTSFHSKHKTSFVHLPIFSLVLHSTIFHPQGGGQPSDSGVIEIGIEKPATFQVVFAQKGKEGYVEHFGYFDEGVDVKSIAELINSETFVHMKLDAEKRLLHTRLHSAGHALDAAVFRCSNKYELVLAPSKGYHFTDGPYVEYQIVGGVLEPSEQLLKAFVVDLNEALIEIIREDIPTEVLIEPSEGLDGFLRTVVLAGTPCPCGGTHVTSTGQLRLVTVTKAKRKKNILKLSYTLD